MSMQCQFEEPWQGTCGTPVVETSPPRCHEHHELTCSVCDELAVTRCKASFGMMCGAPLCEDHDESDCTFHPQ